MKYNFKKIKYLFSINNNDMRSDFFLFIIFDILNRNNILTYNILNNNILTSNILYNSPFTYNMIHNIEWINYCMDLAYEDIEFKWPEVNTSNINIIKTIIKTFFIVIDNDNNIIHIDNNNNNNNNNISKLSNTSRLIRSKDKIIKFTTIIPSYEYLKSSQNSFTFNTVIFKDMLKKMLENIPAVDMISENTLINPVKQCLKKKKMEYFEYITKCMNGSDINNCIKFMQNKNYYDKIKKEVANMDKCICVDILIKFGFKYQDSNLELYETWEKRIIYNLQINKINMMLKQYILLLIQRLNPILELKQILDKNKNIGIENVLIKYKKLYPNMINTSIIDNYIILERKYFISLYILDCYYNLLKIFNNRIVFNYNNMQTYINYHDLIFNIYSDKQSFILKKIENILI